MKTFLLFLLLLFPSWAAAGQELPQVCRDAEAMSMAPGGDPAEELGLYEKCLDNELSPVVRASALFNMGVIHDDMGNWEQALARYEAATRVDPQDFRSYNNMALILASCAEPSVLDGERALELARKACEISANIATFDTYAMALARAGRYEKAATMERELIRKARGLDGFPSVFMTGMEDRLALYAAGSPYTEAPSTADESQ